MTLKVILFYFRSNIVKRFIRSMRRFYLGLYNYKEHTFDRVRAKKNRQISNVSLQSILYRIVEIIFHVFCHYHIFQFIQRQEHT